MKFCPRHRLPVRVEVRARNLLEYVGAKPKIGRKFVTWGRAKRAVFQLHYVSTFSKFLGNLLSKEFIFIARVKKEFHECLNISKLTLHAIKIFERWKR